MTKPTSVLSRAARRRPPARASAWWAVLGTGLYSCSAGAPPAAVPSASSAPPADAATLESSEGAQAGAEPSTLELLAKLDAAERGQTEAEEQSAAPIAGTTPSLESLDDFDTEAWLKRQGVRRWTADRACSRGPAAAAGAPKEEENTCLCRGTIRVAGRELLLCQNPHGQATDSPVPFVTHTVLYEARLGKLHVALDVPTSAAATGCKADRVAPCWMNLRVAPEGDGLTVTDGSTRGCDVVLRELDELIRYGEQQLIPLRSVYRAICASRGRYSWRGGLLAQEADTLGVRQLGR